MESKILTADEAREIVEKDYSDDLSEIMLQIEMAAKNGRTYLKLYKPIKTETKNRLIDLGYDMSSSIDVESQIMGLRHIIEW